jgi:hypothetical protein
MAIQCRGARHELDNEPWPVGPTVRAMTVGFLDTLQGRSQDGVWLPQACTWF